MAKPKSNAERFWAKVDRRGPDECWPWRGARSDGGSGRLRDEHNRVRPAGQIAWALAHEAPFPDGRYACHRCDNPPCVNPAHIFPGTQAENIADMISKGRRRPDDPMAPARARVVVNRNRRAKLDASTVRLIRDLLASRPGNGETMRSIAARFGVAASTVCRVLSGAWEAVPR